MFSYFQPYSSPALQAYVEEQFSFAMDFYQNIFQGMLKLGELNLQVMNALMQESIFSTEQLVTAPDKAEALGEIASSVVPPVEKVRGYQQHLQNIITETQTSVSETIEAHVPEAMHTTEAVVQELVQHVSEDILKVVEVQAHTLEKLVTTTE